MEVQQRQAEIDQDTRISVLSKFVGTMYVGTMLSTRSGLVKPFDDMGRVFGGSNKYLNTLLHAGSIVGLYSCLFIGLRLRTMATIIMVAGLALIVLMLRIITLIRLKWVHFKIKRAVESLNEKDSILWDNMPSLPKKLRLTDQDIETIKDNVFLEETNIDRHLSFDIDPDNLSVAHIKDMLKMVGDKSHADAYQGLCKSCLKNVIGSIPVDIHPNDALEIIEEGLGRKAVVRKPPMLLAEDIKRLKQIFKKPNPGVTEPNQNQNEQPAP